MGSTDAPPLSADAGAICAVCTATYQDVHLKLAQDNTGQDQSLTTPCARLDSLGLVSWVAQRIGSVSSLTIQALSAAVRKQVRMRSS